MTTYAITGVTGRFGKIAVNYLTEIVGASHVVALARNTERAKKIVPVGVEVRSGDYTNSEQLVFSLQGVDRLLFVSSQPGGPVTREQQHRNVVEAAKIAGVGYIAYTSFPHADISTATLAGDHKKTEEYIKASGLAYSFLRNNWYLENEVDTLKGATLGKPFVYSAGEGKAGWALEREYAEAAVNVIISDNKKNIYEFSGEARSYGDLAANIQGEFDIVSIDDETYSEELKAIGLNDDLAALVTSFQTLIREGQLNENTKDLENALEHPLSPIADAIKEVVEDSTRV